MVLRAGFLKINLWMSTSLRKKFKACFLSLVELNRVLLQECIILLFFLKDYYIKW